ncbi:placenta-specific gene 8 protein-like [Nelusetta ayraudi]|uniref:placenta-specific gene 8 protein-like n=1 Tax=Nelusetta ayraudi TaxID=303726 RepID=UPI003F7270EB
MDEELQREWHTSLCDCFEDASTCCYGFWCCPCLACTVSSQFGEGGCLPLCDLCSLAVTSALEIPLMVASPALLSLRASVRHKHKIKGSLCQDIAVSCFCVWCGWCQLHRELKNLRRPPVVINVVNIQPAPAVQHVPVVMAPAYPVHNVAFL